MSNHPPTPSASATGPCPTLELSLSPKTHVSEDKMTRYYGQFGLLFLSVYYNPVSRTPRH